MAVRKEFEGMGFRHLFGFNLAILAKQGWKLSIDPNVMMSRVFKAKYYRKGFVLGAALGHNPSFVWHSIHDSQVVVRGGWR